MFYYISHRGNLNGPNPSRENSPDYILSAINEGFDVEVDVWFIDNKFFLGHDYAKYEVSDKFLDNDNLWIHAKNYDAFFSLLKVSYNNVFWHTTEDYVLTSNRIVWAHQGKPITPESICLMPEMGYVGELYSGRGICSDYIKTFRKW